MRQRYDLSHKVMQALKIGRLQTVARIPTVPGDSLSLSVNAFIRLNQLRRPVPFDLRCDLFAFWLPLRWTYTALKEMITTGDNPATSFTTATMEEGVRACSLLANGLVLSQLPRHIRDDYIRIWNHYFRNPSDPELTYVDATYGATQTDNEWYGLPCGAMKTMPTALRYNYDPLQDHLISTADMPASEGHYEIDVRQVPQQLAKWREEMFREWTGKRFEEVHENLWGVAPPSDAAQVPISLGRSERWFSSTDVNGTAGDDLGKVVGKSVTAARLRCPRKFFREHGTLWAFMLIRPHPVFASERHYLDDVEHMRQYSALASTPEGAVQLPVELTFADLFWDGDASVKAGWCPNNQWYRTHPSYAHYQLSGDFDSITEESIDAGWEPRLTPTTPQALSRVADYSDMFETLAAGHGKAFCNNSVQVDRLTNDAMASIMAR